MSDISQGTVYVTAEELTGTSVLNNARRGRRGVNVYTLSDLLSVSGEAKDGRIIPGTIQQNLFTLSIDERTQIYRKNFTVHGLVNGRMSRIAGRDWKVTRDSKDEDRIAAFIQMAAQLYDEYDNPQSVLDLTVRSRCVMFCRRWLQDLKPDMSNFMPAMLRWKHKLRMKYEDRSTEIEDWIHKPNHQDSFDEFVKKTVSDALIHGASSWYKARDPSTEQIDEVYVLPGGTVLPFRSMFVGGVTAYAQILNGVPPKVYFHDEVSYLAYAPNSGLSYGAVPLEALVNRIAEVLLFEEQAAMKADGTSAPEKLVVFNDPFPFGDDDTSKDLTMPLTQDEQSRLEVLVNEPRRNAIRILSGYGGQGQPQVVDLSRESTFQAQSEREDKIIRSIAMCFNATNVEVGLTGSGDTSGRETSETQTEVDRANGWMPLAMLIEDRFNTDIIPERFESGYNLECDKGMNEAEQIDIESKKLQSGSYSVNEIRTDRGDDPFPEEQYDRPPGGGEKQEPPDGSEGNPMNVKMAQRGRSIVRR